MTIQDAFYDVIGVGFGPSNLALAIALDDAVRRRGAICAHHFIEKQPGFTWHGGMLLPDSDMQISFIKDLVSLRDPTSPLTFINYLHEKGRLEAFINQKTFFPSRVEFNDYLGWVAARFEDRCSYGEEVVAIEPETAQGTVTCLRVRSRTGSGGETVRRAHNLVVATGGSPRIPAVFARLGGDARVFHSARYLDRIGELGLERQPAARVAVIGGGQSAAEITLDLHGRFPELKVDLIFRGHALKPADDTPFVNEIFNPDFTDYVFGQTAARRDAIIREFRNTNYAVVDADLIEKIYAILYQQKVRRCTRLALFGRSEVTHAAVSADGLELVVVDGIAGTAGPRRYDAVVLATGYDRETGHRLLSALAPYVEDFAVDRDYRLRTRPDFRPQIHLQGTSETSHGLSDTLLSVLAVRSQEIADSLLAAKGRRGAPPDLRDVSPPPRRFAVNDD
jgi:L-ornithine N5-oxygenase